MSWTRDPSTPIPEASLCIRCRDAYRQDGRYCRICSRAVGQLTPGTVEQERRRVEQQHAKIDRLKPQSDTPLEFAFTQAFDWTRFNPETKRYGAWVEFEIWNGVRWSTDPPAQWELELTRRQQARAFAERDAERR